MRSSPRDLPHGRPSGGTCEFSPHGKCAPAQETRDFSTLHFGTLRRPARVSDLRDSWILGHGCVPLDEIYLPERPSGGTCDP